MLRGLDVFPGRLVVGRGGSRAACRISPPRWVFQDSRPADLAAPMTVPGLLPPLNRILPARLGQRARYTPPVSMIAALRLQPATWGRSLQSGERRLPVGPDAPLVTRAFRMVKNEGVGGPDWPYPLPALLSNMLTVAIRQLAPTPCRLAPGRSRRITLCSRAEHTLFPEDRQLACPSTPPQSSTPRRRQLL